MCNDNVMQQERQQPTVLEEERRREEQEQEQQELREQELRRRVLEQEGDRFRMGRGHKEKLAEELAPDQRQRDLRAAWLLRRELQGLGEALPEETARVEQPVQTQPLTDKEKDRLERQYKSDLKAAAKKHHAQRRRQQEAARRQVGELPPGLGAFADLALDRRGRLLPGQEEKLRELAELGRLSGGSGQEQKEATRRLLRQVLKTEVRPDMLTRENIRDNFAALSRLASQLDYVFGQKNHLALYAELSLTDRKKFEELKRNRDLIRQVLLYHTNALGFDTDGSSVGRDLQQQAKDGLSGENGEALRERMSLFAHRYNTASEYVINEHEWLRWRPVQGEQMQKRLQLMAEDSRQTETDPLLQQVKVVGLEDLADPRVLGEIERTRELVARGARHAGDAQMIARIYERQLACAEAYSWNEIRRIALEELKDHPKIDPETLVLADSRGEMLTRGGETLFREIALCTRAVAYLMGERPVAADADALYFLRDRFQCPTPELEELERNQIREDALLYPARWQSMADAWSSVGHAMPGWELLDEKARSRGALMADLENEANTRDAVRMYINMAGMKREIAGHQQNEATKGQPFPYTQEHTRTLEYLQRTLVPQYEKILSADLDRYLEVAGSEDGLLRLNEEITLLQNNCMVISDLGLEKMPDGAVIKDTILGDRREEFGNKSAILQALARKARGLAMLRALRSGTLTDEMLSNNDREHIGSVKDASHEALEQQFQKLVTSADGMLGVYLKTYREKRGEWAGRGTLYNSPGVVKIFTDRYSVNEGYSRPNRNLDDLTKQLVKLRSASEADPVEGITPEGVKRLMDQDYHLTCDSRTIREPLFRSFSAFLSLTAAQSLSREAFADMLRDLTAGADFEQEVNREIAELEEARGGGPEAKMAAREEVLERHRDQIAQYREINLRGARKYKEILKQQYAYIEDHFGAEFESQDLPAVLEHLDEIQAEGGNVQVEHSLLTRLPGLMDDQDPGDQHFLDCVCYYNDKYTFVSGARTVYKVEKKYEGAQRSWTYMQPGERPLRFLAHLQDTGARKRANWNPVL